MTSQLSGARKLTARQTMWASIGAVVLGLCCCGGTIGAFSDDGGSDPQPATPSASRSASPSPSAASLPPSPSPSLSPSPSSSPSVAVTTASAPATDKRYKNCQEVIGDGRGPYTRGTDPEYDWYIDRDADGVVCESGESSGGGSGSSGGGSGSSGGGSGDPGGSPVYYKNCTAARNAGAAPVYAGQSGYGRHLDRDGDGVGCE